MNIKVNNKNKTNSLIINNYLSKSYFDYLEYPDTKKKIS